MGREVVFELFASSEVEAEADGPADDAHSPCLPEHTLALPTVVHSLLQELLRLFALHLVVCLLPPFPPTPPSSFRPPPSYPPSLPPLDPLFFSALWFALGWSATEIVWSSRTLWRQLELYRDVLGQDARGEEEVLRGVPRVQVDEEEDGQEEWRFRRRCMDVVDGLPRHLVHRYSSSEGGDDDDGRHRRDNERDGGFEDDEDEDEMDDEVFRLRMREVQREELETQLGVPLYEVPVGVIFIWRLDSILLSLVFTLLLSLPFRLTPPTLITFSVWPTFLAVSSTHALLAWLWLAKVRRMGIPSISYASLVVLVGLMFGTLGAWGVLQ